MTRETKIGLLVGLAFIIVVGILLSDHMTAATEPPPAPLQMAGMSLRSGLGQPLSEEPAAPVGPSIAPAAVTPQQPVPTQEEVAPPPPAPDVSRTPLAPAAASPVASPVEPTSPANTLSDAAHRAGEELVDGDGQPVNEDQSPAAPVAVSVRPASATRSYKVQPGDSLSKIALKLMGANTRANRQAIIDANASLRADPNMLVVGRTYAVPVPSSTAAAPVVVSPTGTSPVAAAPVTAERASKAKSIASADEEPHSTYTVKPGDTLWSIAVNQLGDAGTIAAIKELNRDVLKDGSHLRPRMKLKLPAKPVASADES